jgi:hypothetical protein
MGVHQDRKRVKTDDVSVVAGSHTYTWQVKDADAMVTLNARIYA